jgi:hypothetical protein
LWNQKNFLSKSNNKTLSELLAGDGEFRIQTERILNKNGFKMQKKQSIKQLAKTLNHHAKKLEFNCFEELKKFEGFEKESSDDSLVKLDCKFKNFKQEYSKRVKWFKKRANKEILIPERTQSPMLMRSKFSNTNEFQSNSEVDQSLWEKAMQEYLEARKSMDIGQFSKNKMAKTHRRKESKKITYPVSVSPEVTQRSSTTVLTPYWFTMDRKSYVGELHSKLQKSQFDGQRKSFEWEYKFNPSATGNLECNLSYSQEHSVRFTALPCPIPSEKHFFR